MPWDYLMHEDQTITLQYPITENSICNYCQQQLTNENSAVFSIVSNDYAQDMLYCKPCGQNILGKINRLVGEATGTLDELCSLCNMAKTSKKGCCCKNISYKLRKSLK